MDINVILEELGRNMGLSKVALDHNGVCRLVFDKVLVVDIEATKDDFVYLHAVVGQIPHQQKQELYQALLEANLFGKGTGSASFGIDVPRNEILLYRRFYMDRTDYKDFVDGLEQFVNILELWMKKLDMQDYGLEPTAEAGDNLPRSKAVEDEAVPPFRSKDEPPQDFLRV